MSRTMARPSPVPGTLSSSLSPRSPTSCAFLGIEARAVVVDRQCETGAVRCGRPKRATRAIRPFAGIVHQIAGHLFQILPFAAKGELRRTIDRDGDAALRMDARQHARQIVQHRFYRRAVAEHVDARRRRARARDNDRPGGAWSSTWRCTASASGPGWAAASLESTVSGVFRKCARLETCVRARPTTSALCSMRLLSSLASGAISAGNFPSRRRALPSRMRASASLTRRSGCKADAHLDEDRRDQTQCPEARTTRSACR